MATSHRWKGTEFRTRFERAARQALEVAARTLSTEIKFQLNKTGPGDSSPAGQPPARQKGLLGQSISVDLSRLHQFIARVGPDPRTKDYSAAQEYGHPGITPSAAKFLAIPLHKAARDMRREVGTGSLREIAELHILKKKDGRLFLAVGGRPYFRLVRSVKLDARPYLRASLTLAGARLRAILSGPGILGRM